MLTVLLSLCALQGGLRAARVARMRMDARPLRGAPPASNHSVMPGPGRASARQLVPGCHASMCGDMERPPLGGHVPGRAAPGCPFLPRERPCGAGHDAWLGLSPRPQSAGARRWGGAGLRPGRLRAGAAPGGGGIVMLAAVSGEGARGPWRGRHGAAGARGGRPGVVAGGDGAGLAVATGPGQGSLVGGSGCGWPRPV